MVKTFSPQIWKKQDTILVSLPYDDFDQTASQHFKEMVHAITEKYRFNCLIIDFSRVMLIDATGLAAVVQALNTCSAKNIKLIVSSLRQNLFEIMNNRGILSLVEFFDNVHDALDSATKFASMQESIMKRTKSLETVFGNPFEEEDILY